MKLISEINIRKIPLIPRRKMKFHKAIIMMNPGDCFSPDGSKYSEFIMNENGTFKGSTCDNPKELALSKEMLMIEGKIIPAKPKVLDAEEIVLERFKKYSELPDTSEPTIKQTRKELLKFTEFVHQNGRLERDLELMELTEAVGSLANEFESGQISDKYHGFIKPVVRALKNLKQLNKDE